MQQTDKYQLNLIERDDVFSPDALNENAEKLEGALEAEAAARTAAEASLAGADAALAQRVTALEAKKIVVGHYQGNGAKSRTFDLGFTPVAVLIHGTNSHVNGSSALAVTGHNVTYYSLQIVSIVTNGFQLSWNDTAPPCNISGYEYNYLALA